MWFTKIVMERILLMLECELCGINGWVWGIDYKKINLKIVKQLFILLFMNKLGIVSFRFRSSSDLDVDYDYLKLGSSFGNALQLVNTMIPSCCYRWWWSGHEFMVTPPGR